MIEWRFLNSQEKKKIEATLKGEFGIKKIPGELISAGSEKLFLFSGDASESDVKEFIEISPVDRVGIYFAKVFDDGIRLSVDGVQIMKDQISRNIVELDEEQAETWMQGSELLLKTGKKGYVVMKYKNDFLGCGKASAEKITNFIPKNRRLKNRLN